MSCQFALLSNFQDLSKVKGYLFPHLKEDTPEREPQKDDDWDVDWDQWNEEEEEDDSQPMEMEEEVPEDNGFNKNSWLQNCLVSLSPTNDLMAVAFQEKIVLMTQKYDPKNQENEIDTKLTTVYEGSLSQEEGETITAVLCLPLASQKRSTQGGPDWTCVVVGFSSGNIRMYTETGTLLLSQLLHTEPIQKLKCHTYQPPRYLGLAEQHEELVILYRRALVTIDGFSLFQSLRACRNQVARATASGGDSILQVPPLAYKKWALQGQDKLLDCCSCGVDTPNPFDQMKTQSIVSGHTASIRPTPPAAAMYVTSGVGPYVGFFYAVEGTAQPILSEVAFAVAHKLKSAIMSAASGWLGFGSKQKEEEKQKPKIEPATPLSHRFGLPDKRRQGDMICLSPNSNYAATTDSFGRVTLLDVERGVAIRMWKGYRDAQLGWIEVKEDIHVSRQKENQCRVAQFLVIYAPRRGILEVWATANGPRVAAFNVSKWCALVCPGYGMMGLNNVTCRGVKTRVFQCGLIDPAGGIKTLDIPFHLALSDKNSKRARDLHLLKKLKATLKDSSEESESLEGTVTNLLLDMKIASIRQQGTDKVLGTKYLSAACMQRVLKACLLQVTAKDEDSLDIDSKLFVKYCNIHDDLLRLYMSIHQANLTTAQPDSEVDVSESLAKILRISESEAAHLITQLEQFDTADADSQTTKHVKFVLEQTFSAASFLSCFHSHLHIGEQDSNKAPSVTIATRISEEKKRNLAGYVFHHTITQNVDPEDFCKVLQDCNLSPGLLIKLLVFYWMSDDARKLSMVSNLYCIIKSMTSAIDIPSILVDPGEISPWWQNIRDACHHSSNIRAAYIIAVTCRGVATELASSKDEDADAESDEQSKGDNSEPSTMPPLLDLEHWNISVKQLEDVLCLSCLLQMSPSEGNVQKAEPITVSVTKLMEGGRGAVSELVGCYITQYGLHPGDLFRTCNLTDSVMSTEGAAEATETLQLSAEERLQGQLEVLRQRFPHSLENDVLLSNACWENVVQWNKDPEVVQYLQCAMEYLRLVQNALLRQGVGSLLWHMFVAKKFSSAAHLMEKVGKAPKDRLCRKEVGIGEVQLIHFIGCICDLLDIIMEANCDSNEVPVFNIEHLWQGVRGPASLVELAIDQKATNYGLLRHHYHLAVLMHAILVFQMKSVKVLSLFDSKGKNSFFLDLHQHPLLPSQNIDTAISNNRRQFLSRILTNAVLMLESPKSFDSSPPSSPSSPARRLTGAASKWPALVLEIAKDFGLDLDFLKRHHVCELYSGAHDRLAEEVLQTVNDHELMGSQLLMVAGYRTAHFLLESHKHRGVELLTTVSPALSSWLKSLEKSQLRHPAVPANDIAMLVQHVANDLPEGYPEYELAISLVDLVQSLS